MAIHLTKGRAKACVIAVEDGGEDGACDQADGANSRLFLADDRYYATSPMDEPAGDYQGKADKTNAKRDFARAKQLGYQP